MIGVFDSGYGGLTILHGLVEILPQYDYIYLGDNARAPYGSRSAHEIIKYTQQGVEWLFQHNCPVVILGCNTASAVALRILQQEFLPQHYPDRRILGIVVPTIEQITGIHWNTSLGVSSAALKQTIGLLATEQTVASGTYIQEITKRNPAIQLIQQSAPDLVKIIEQEAGAELIKKTTQAYLNQLFTKAENINPPLSALLLGCTHFEIIADIIHGLLPPGITLYEQPAIVATSFKKYLSRHPEVENKLTKTGEQEFYTTSNPQEVSTRSSRFFGRELEFRQINL